LYEIESTDAFLPVHRCKWDVSYYHFDDDPIYDTKNDEREIVGFGPMSNQVCPYYRNKYIYRYTMGMSKFKIQQK
jgi:hypothetical protein